MKTNRFLALVFPVLCVLMVPAFVAAEGWSLNPFAKKSGSERVSEGGNSWFPSGKKPGSSFASSRTTEPSTWQKMSRGTSNAWNKTTSALNPWKKDTKTTPARVTGARRPTNMPRQEPKSTWYKPTTWFGKEQASSQPKRPETVSEWLNQPRVQ